MQRATKKTLGILLLLAVTTAPTRSQDLVFEHYRVQEGLPNNSVSAIVQDQVGFLWFGTFQGLVRYDGYDFTLFQSNSADSTTLSDDRIFSLLADRQGAVWIGTEKGAVNRFDPATQQFTRYLPDSSQATAMQGMEVFALYEDQASQIWAGSSAGLFQFQPATDDFRHYRLDPNVVSDSVAHNVYAITEDHAGVLWVGTAHGLMQVDVEAGHLRRVSEHSLLQQSTVSALLEDDNHNLWVGTWGKSLFQLDATRTQLAHFESDPSDLTSLSDSTIKTLYQDPHGALWIGTGGQEFNGGINRMDWPSQARRPTFTRYERDVKEASTLGSNRVWSILEDRSGVLWVGTLYGGLHKFDRSQHKFPFTRANTSQELQRHEAFVFYEDRAGTLWIGTWGDGLARVDAKTGQYTYYTSQSHGFKQDRIRSVYEDTKGRFWIGTWGGGLHRLNRETGELTVYQHDPDDPETLSNNHVMTLFEDRQGTFWVGTHRGLNRFDPETGIAKRYLSLPRVSNQEDQEQIWVMLDDIDGRLWLGTRNGLFRYDQADDAFVQYTLQPEGQVKQIVRDRQGLFWIVTQAEVLTRFNPATEVFTSFGEEEGLPHEVVQGLLEDDDGYLWISTEKALSRYDPETQSFHHYDASDGLAGEDLLFDSAHKTRSGELFWANERGYMGFHPNDLRDNDHAPLVGLTDFKLFNEAVPVGMLDESSMPAHISVADEIRLAHWQNDLTFGFSALHYSQPERIQYAYMLENEDETWWEVGNRREAVYPNLDPGDYVFRVRAANHDGVWSEEGAALRIVITPPWWQTWWFRFFALASVLGLTYAGFRARVRSVESRNLALEAEVSRRTAEVEEQKAALELQHAKIEAQAQQLQALDHMKSRFFANISHEFRTPLSLMLGPVEDALRARDEAIEQANLEMMQRNGHRLLRLINQLLDLARIEAGKMPLEAARGDLVGFLRAVVFSLESMAARKNITLRFSDQLKTSKAAYFDRDKLEKVLYNVLSNALKFTPQQGAVDVVIQATPDHTFAEILVSDTGPGIAPEARKHIFDRFYQVPPASDATQGTGIGLALARELIQLHGGSIEVESDLGRGSIFIIRLPLGRSHLSKEQIVQDSLSAVWRPEHGDGAAVSLEVSMGSGEVIPDREVVAGNIRKATVLIVDDNADVRRYLRGHLINKYEIREAANGKIGLEKARQEVPDLIISDVMMPDMDGFELCAAVKSDAVLNHIPVILLTAKASDESKLEGLETGADDYIYKPFNAEELLLRVENLIAVRRLLQQRFTQYVVMQPEEVTVQSADAAFLEQVRATVEAEMGNSHFGVAMLADAMALSERQLYRKLESLLNVSPAGFIRTMRLQRAAQLLEQQAGNISEVAYAIGFNNPKYFSRLFRQVFGVTPTAYMRQHSS